MSDVTPAAARESYGRHLANIVSVLLALGAVGYASLRPRPAQDVPPVALPQAPVQPVVASAPSPSPAPVPAPAPRAEPPQLDRDAVAEAETALDAASRDRARADGRVQEAERTLADAVAQAHLDESRAKKLALRVHDPSTRLALVSSQGGFLKAQRDRLKDEVATIRKAPRPKAKELSDTTPVARPPGGDEYHFELRRNRVSYIDLDHLLELVKADAQLHMRSSASNGLIESKVGPVGSFSLAYALGRATPSIGDMLDRRSVVYSIRGWEVVPELEGRGETYEATRSPVSEYARAINRLNPARATVTMWIYPDGFTLYRKLRDDLHARGYLVAARPLPEGLSIRGSPAGSVSAGQ